MWYNISHNSGTTNHVTNFNNQRICDITNDKIQQTESGRRSLRIYYKWIIITALGLLLTISLNWRLPVWCWLTIQDKFINTKHKQVNSAMILTFCSIKLNFPRDSMINRNTMLKPAVRSFLSLLMAP